MSKVYFIADTHFNHANIIKYCNRPFYTTDEMNSYLIKQWNNTVSNDDKVFMLGDFALGSKETVERFVSCLNGQKHLIIGNHDRWTPAIYRRLGFDDASRYPILWNDFYLLSHAPKFTTNDSPFFNIYGHVHNDSNYKDFTSNSFCVSAERIDYKPISFEQIVKKIKKEGI